jgi:hypothetical protein
MKRINGGHLANFPQDASRQQLPFGQLEGQSLRKRKSEDGIATDPFDCRGSNVTSCV